MTRTAEIGHAQARRSSPLAEDNWALRWPQSVREFSKMLREDSQARSVERAVTLPILRTSWYLEANGAPEAIVRVIAEDLNLPVKGDSGSAPLPQAVGRVSWQETLPWILKYLRYGHAYFEKVYSDGSDGPQRLVKLAPRLADTIEKIKIARDGGVEALVQRGGIDQSGVSFESVEIEVSRLLFFIFDEEQKDGLGTSIFRPAYKHWRLKDEFLQLERTVLERNGMGVPYYESYSETDQEDIDRGQELVEGLRSGAEVGASGKKGSKLSILGVSGQLVSPREAIVYHDAQIARTTLAHALNLEGKGGSYALAEVQMDMFIQSLQTIAEYIATIVNKYLITDMVEKFTGEKIGPFPKITFETIGTRTGFTAQDLVALKNAGLLIADDSVQEYVRRRGELPPITPVREALEKKLERKQLEEELGVTFGAGVQPPATEGQKL
ncbi:phage portal protein family protein, partial [Corynebacterium ulcerans]|uniref:phage portal protein family protein n=1 Tax=Corynebacterium ulcerans TaxID=65058 RepID=UPI00065B5916